MPSIKAATPHASAIHCRQKGIFCPFFGLVAAQYCQVMQITNIPINVMILNKNLVTTT